MPVSDATRALTLRALLNTGANRAPKFIRDMCECDCQCVCLCERASVSRRRRNCKLTQLKFLRAKTRQSYNTTAAAPQLLTPAGSGPWRPSAQFARPLTPGPFPAQSPRTYTSFSHPRCAFGKYCGKLTYLCLNLLIVDQIPSLELC